MTDMNYIKKRADKFVERYIVGQVSDHQNVIDAAKSEIYNIDDDLDKVTFLRVVLEVNAKEYRDHLLVCSNKIGCPTNFDHESIAYFLTQELNGLGIRTNNDQFTIEEKADAESKLDQVLNDLQTLKDGHQIIYDDLKAEIDDLKELFILGKKTWFQLLLGKTREMVISGVISETVSKQITAELEKEVQKLLS
jgi:hypothetical protein